MDTQKRILLVDDESSIRRTLSFGLAQRGYEADPCADGVSALMRMETLEKDGAMPAAVVLDIQLPDILGTKLARIINFKYPNIPIFLITGYADKLNPSEIKDLKVTALLEKPLSTDELADRFESVMAKQSPAPEVIPESVVEPATSVSAYLLLKLDESKNFFESYQKLYYMDNVVYCDATKGEYDIFMLIQANTREQINAVIEQKVKTVEGVKEVEVLQLEPPLLSEALENVIHAAEDALHEGEEDDQNAREMSNLVCSYLLLEIEKDKLEKIYPALRLNENVVYCDYTTGTYNLVVFLHGRFYSDIDKFIEEHITSMDGVLRVKEYPVVNLLGM
ncbi:MAG: response regulator [Acidobacteria bacterium]|nr:response regulator [Acidobacteriota bacterium]